MSQTQGWQIKLQGTFHGAQACCSLPPHVSQAPPHTVCPQLSGSAGSSLSLCVCVRARVCVWVCVSLTHTKMGEILERRFFEVERSLWDGMIMTRTKTELN